MFSFFFCFLFFFFNLFTLAIKFIIFFLFLHLQFFIISFNYQFILKLNNDLMIFKNYSNNNFIIFTIITKYYFTIII